MESSIHKWHSFSEQKSSPRFFAEGTFRYADVNRRFVRVINWLKLEFSLFAYICVCDWLGNVEKEYPGVSKQNTVMIPKNEEIEGNETFMERRSKKGLIWIQVILLLLPKIPCSIDEQQSVSHNYHEREIIRQWVFSGWSKRAKESYLHFATSHLTFVSSELKKIHFSSTVFLRCRVQSRPWSCHSVFNLVRKWSASVSDVSVFWNFSFAFQMNSPPFLNVSTLERVFSNVWVYEFDLNKSKTCRPNASVLKQKMH